MTDFNIDVLAGSFQAQAERLTRMVESKRITPELASLLLSYYALGRAEATGEVCDVVSSAKVFNPDHDVTMQLFRKSRSAHLVFTK